MWLTRTPSTSLETTLFGKVLLLAGSQRASFVDQSLRSIQDAGSKLHDIHVRRFRIKVRTFRMDEPGLR